MKNLSLKNKSHEKRLVLLTLLFTDPKLCSTRCTVYSIYVHTNINPAYAGSRGVMSILHCIERSGLDLARQ
jgi:hypothetical protein